MDFHDLREKKTSNNSTAIPNDLLDKYVNLFNKDQLVAVLYMIRQTYWAGLVTGWKFPVIDKAKDYPRAIPIPNGLLTNINLFDGEQIAVILGLISQTYMAGILTGRNEVEDDLLREQMGGNY